MSQMGAGATGQTEEGEGIVETISEQATQVKNTGRRELREQLDERTTQVGQQTRTLASALRRSGKEAQGAGAGGVDSITSGIADQLERAGSYLERAKGEEMLGDAEQFVRTRPWLVAGAAVAAGFLVSRVVKASSERRYDGSSHGSRSSRMPVAGQGVRRTDDDRMPLGSEPLAAAGGPS
jgi:ElaB/YqjD/DUF883 family membrane-anchored ribosome-binding protein